MGCDTGPDTNQLIADLNGAPVPAGCYGDQPEGSPQGGAYRTDLLGQVLQILQAEDIEPAAKAAGLAALGIQQVVSTEKMLTGMLDTALGLAGIRWPAMQAMRIGDPMVGLPHMHTPVLPTPPFGPVFRMTWLPQLGFALEMGFLSGAPTVKVNGQPAARCGDMGLAIPFCLGFIPFFEIFLGSATVWFDGQRAARLLDATNDCMACDAAIGIGKVGFCIGLSGNVHIGGIPLPSFTDMFIGLVIHAVTHGLTRLIKRLARVGWISKAARRLAGLPGISHALERLGRLRGAVDGYFSRWQKWIDDARPPPRSFGMLPERFRTVNMRRDYLYEQYPFNRQWSPFFPQGVTYLDDAGRDARRLFAVDGQLFNEAGMLPDSSANNIIVMDAQGNIYTGSTATGRFQHSSFLGGEPVAFAGEIHIEDGVPTYISNASGHYWPPAELWPNLERRLQEMGIDTSNIVFDTVGG